MADKEKKSLLEEFKEFIAKGNVMNLAVGVIIGAAFQNIVTALTNSFINPLIAVLTGGVEKDPETGALKFIGGTFEIAGVTFDYGAFISAVINFFIMAAILFAIVKAVNKAMDIGKKKEEPEPAPEPEPEPAPEPDPQIVLLEEIRDLLKEKNE